MTSPTRWAIASTGNISTDMAITLSSLPKDEHQIVAVASRTLEKGQAFARKFNIPKSYGSHEEIAKYKDIDVVYIGTIPTMIYALTHLYIKKGHNVVCEAPFTKTSKEAKELVELAKQNNVFLLEVNQTLYSPAYVEMLEQIRQGAIGTPRLMIANIGTDLRALLSRRHTRRYESAGLLALLYGRWGIVLSQHIFGKEAKPRIVANATYTDNGPDVITVILTFSDHCMAVINCSSAITLDKTFTVYATGGTNGNSLKLDNVFVPTELICGKEVSTFDVPESQKFTPIYKTTHFFRYMSVSVRNCLLKGLKESPVLPLKQSIQASEVIDEIRMQIGLVYGVTYG